MTEECTSIMACINAWQPACLPARHGLVLFQGQQGATHLGHALSPLPLATIHLAHTHRSPHCPSRSPCPCQSTGMRWSRR
jgi:hypothetical protein